jgi:flavin reductase (DIM6/NTAB) family NADH-FMN oxidoreductase RutF
MNHLDAGAGALPEDGRRLIPMSELDKQERYQLITSLIVPRPIGWVSTRTPEGVPNLAPFSYFAALSTSPMLLGVSIASRKGAPKDTLVNIRSSGCFCVNVVSDRHVDAMNESAAEHPHGINEFELAGVRAAKGGLVSAPYVADCPAVFECRVFREVELDGESNVFVIGEVVAVRLEPALLTKPGSYLVDPEALRPVARLGGNFYAYLGPIRSLDRPIIR